MQLNAPKSCEFFANAQFVCVNTFVRVIELARPGREGESGKIGHRECINFYQRKYPKKQESRPSESVTQQDIKRFTLPATSLQPPVFLFSTQLFLRFSVQMFSLSLFPSLSRAHSVSLFLSWPWSRNLQIYGLETFIASKNMYEATTMRLTAQGPEIRMQSGNCLRK